MANELERSKTDKLASTNLIPIPESGSVTAQAECPFCDELVSVKARKCRHCGETIDIAMRKAEEAMRHSERSPTVFMNAGGGAAAATASTDGLQLRPFQHFWHIILSVLTAGIWLPVWFLLYVFRNRSIYW